MRSIIIGALCGVAGALSYHHFILENSTAIKTVSDMHVYDRYSIAIMEKGQRKVEFMINDSSVIEVTPIDAIDLSDIESLSEVQVCYMPGLALLPMDQCRRQ